MSNSNMKIITRKKVMLGCNKPEERNRTLRSIEA